VRYSDGLASAPVNPETGTTDRRFDIQCKPLIGAGIDQTGIDCCRLLDLGPDSFRRRAFGMHLFHHAFDVLTTASHSLHHLQHIALSHPTHVAVSRLRSPITTDLNILATLLILPTRLLRLLRAALWLHWSLRLARGGLGLHLIRRL